MSDIVLATANARFSHSSLGLRCLKANLGDLEERSEIVEFTLEDRASDIAEKLLARSPMIIGLGVYIWNVPMLTDVVSVLKRINPKIAVVLGGPEVGFEDDLPKIAQLANFIIAGEGEIAFRELCRKLLAGDKPKARIIESDLCDLREISMPYRLYDDSDIKNRVLYVEASRGCPFGCEFCLSSLDKKVRRFPEQTIIEELEKLWERGAKRFKFTDRALHLAINDNIAGFFLERADKGLFVHFELIPDKLPEKILEILKKFPPGSVQLEAGVQTLNPAVASRIGRKQNDKKALLNIKQLLTETNAHLHTDLVVGLPGETILSFGQGFDRLITLRPQEIQVGILKRLRGAPISRHNADWEMIYNEQPPYDVLRNKLIDFKTMQRLKRFARYFDLVYNSGNFKSTAALIWGEDSPFLSFLAFTDWLYQETGRTSAIALNKLTEHIFDYLSGERGLDKTLVANSLFDDYARAGRTNLPGRILEHVTRKNPPRKKKDSGTSPPRQQRHK